MADQENYFCLSFVMILEETDKQCHHANSALDQKMIIWILFEGNNKQPILLFCLEDLSTLDMAKQPKDHRPPRAPCCLIHWFGLNLVVLHSYKTPWKEADINSISVVYTIIAPAFVWQVCPYTDAFNETKEERGTSEPIINNRNSQLDGIKMLVNQAP